MNNLSAYVCYNFGLGACLEMTGEQVVEKHLISLYL